MNLNKNAAKIADEMIARQKELGIKAFKLKSGAKIIDCGIAVKGSFEAGKLFAKATMGGEAEINFSFRNFETISLPCVEIWCENPSIACLASQKAGWSVQGKNFSALGSGPARILARKPKQTFEKIGYNEKSIKGVIALEADRYPDEETSKKIARECRIAAKNLYILVAPTKSLVGSIQVSARAVETALFKLEYLGYEVRGIISASAIAPIAPIINKMMGAVNDMIIYGSTVYLVTQDKIEVKKIPSNSSPLYGRPFAEIFEDAGKDFYRINPLLFAPAEVYVNNIVTGEIEHAGNVNPEMLRRSIGI